MSVLEVADYAWLEHARCRELRLPVRLFFYGPGESPDERIVVACRECPVRRRCLDEALMTGARGWWAGTSEKARRRMLK